MKKLVLCASLLTFTTAVYAAKDCGELKDEIEAKIQANGVPAYTLEIVDDDAATDKKIVGTCGGGTKKIVYQRGRVTEEDITIIEVEE